MSEAVAIQTRTANWSTDEPLLRQIRQVVFVIEQNVPVELEWEGDDHQCIHALAFMDEKPVGTGRLSPDGKIGRMAVLAEVRGKGVGGALLTQLLDIAAQQGMEQVYLHAQTHALAFYQRHGFVPDGAEFDEAGIPHRHMVRRLETG